MTNENEPQQSERREHPRIKRLRLISYVSRSKRQRLSVVRMGRTLDISPSGARVEIHQPMFVGTEIELNIAVGNATYTIQGKVMRVTEVGNRTFLVGIRFNKTQKQLLDFPNKQETWTQK